MSRVRLLPLLAAALVAWGCAHGQPAEDEAMLIKASALTKVAAALESAVRYRDAPESLSEAELLDFSTRHDPGLLDPFRELRLRVRRSGVLSSVLLCTQDSDQALIEDAGCTARPDAHLWQRNPRERCEFQLDLAATCAAR